MNSLHELLLIMIITIMNKENCGMQRNNNLNNENYIKQFCDESITDKNVNCGGGSICLPWKLYNESNQTWMEINSNQTQCNLVKCESDRLSICNRDIRWSSTSSSISLKFYDNLSKEILILFYNKISTCPIKEICDPCTHAKEAIKNHFPSCNLTENISREGNSVSFNDLNANKDYSVYVIPIINNITIGSIVKLRLKTKRKAPTNVKITNITSNSISLKWESVLDRSEFEFEFKIILDNNEDHYNYKYIRFTTSNNLEFDKLEPCKEYCFVVSSINRYNMEESDRSQKICNTTKIKFDQVDILPIKSELSTFRFIEWKYNKKNTNNCTLNFSVEYSERENTNMTTTRNNYVNLTELEENKLYMIKVKPSYGEENGELSQKEFFTKEIDDFVEDYIKTKGIFHSLKTSIVFTNLPKSDNANHFSIPIFNESSMTNVEKALKENLNKISKSRQINIENSFSKNKITFSITIPGNLSYETMDFILNLINQDNYCLMNCTDCKLGLNEKLSIWMKNMNEKNKVFCQDKANLIEKAFFVIRLEESESNNFVSIHYINLSDDQSNGIMLQNKCLLILVVILLIIILILMADKKGILSIDDILNIIPIRKRRHANLRNPSSPNSVQMKGQIRENSNFGINQRLLDPNHPQYKLIEEFHKICQESLLLEKSNFTSKVAVLPENMKKNRFKNILPYDQTRVVLQIRNENNDYINASRIPFIDNSELTEYIATQGPLPNTISDFWYMIWEQNISIIVMLTRVYEGVQKKCDQYWPLSLNTEFAFDENLGFSVYMEEEIKNNSFFERKFKIINLNTNEERRVTQIHAVKWNDFSKPENHDFEECLTRFHEITTGNSSFPYLIHCSAGVGRTGTFIACDRLIKKLVKENLNLKIYDVILELRKFRQNMVQQESQYIFIHEFMDYFMCKFKRQSVECQFDNDFTEIPLN